ncbi:MAG TPA: PKD domain-containing protein [Parafilimonas sp.]|nr:PKD domain-containing protein [Parafilimonas sp.]
MKTPLLLVLLVCLEFNATAQTIIGRQLADQYPIGGGSKTYGLTWLPADYNSTNTYYPLIIFLHAAGEVGDGIQGLSKLLNVGLPRKIAEGWDPQAVNPADGKTYKFIVVTPQAPTSSGWSYSYTHVKNILPDVMSRYRVDAKRVYIMGISSGGGGTWSSVTNDSNFTKKFAAILPISSVGVNNPNVESPNIKYISGKYGVKVWTVCGTQDGLYSLASSYVNTINTATPKPAVPALLTGVPKYAHDTALWTMVFDASWRNNSISRNFYEWMLQYQRTDAVQPPPPPNLLPVVNAGPDKSVTLPKDTIKITGTASDIDGTITSYVWTKISGPSQFAIESPTMAETVIRNFVAGIYKFELKVTDNIGATAKDTVAITVLPAPNKPPVVNAGIDLTITLPLDSVLASGTATDQDGTISSYLWSKISGPSQFFITTPVQSQTFITKLVQGVYQFELKVTDNSGSAAKDTMTITVLPAPNMLPVANAGNDQSITLPLDSVLLSGTATDQDGTISAYLWRQISGPVSSSIITPNQSQTIVANLAEGTYRFEFKVTDNSGDAAKDTVTVSVLPAPNKPPVADAGNDQAITLPVNSVTLTGTASDPEGKISSYVWNKVNGPGQINIESPHQLQTLVNGLQEGVYKFELIVTDDHNESDADTVTIAVLRQPNQPPFVNAGNDRVIILPADSLTLQGIANDPDGTITAYQWKKIDGPASFNIVSPDQPETVVSGLHAGIYQFELAATDNEGASSADTVMVSVMDPPPNKIPVASAGDDQVIYLPADNITLNGSGSDTDGTITDYQWEKIDGPDQFLIEQKHQAETVVSGLTQGVYQFELTVTDNDGDISKDTVAITVLPPNQPPVADAGADQEISLPTDSISLSGTASDADGTIASYLWTKVSGPEQFSIVSPGDKNTIADDLTEGTYQFELKVTDNTGGIATDTVTVTVLPAPNQPPVADAGNDQAIYFPADSITLSGSGSDTDGTITDYQWEKIDGPDQFLIEQKHQAQTVVSGLTQGIYQFELMVTDNDGDMSKDTVTITVLPPNQPPVADAGTDQEISLPQDSVSLSGNASDADGTIASYLWTKVSGPEQFSIASSNDKKTIVDDLAEGTYQFELKVTDNAGATARDTLIVTVLPAPNQPPVANAGSDQTITLPKDSVLLSGTASDADGTIASYLWTKLSGPEQFSIASSNDKKTIVDDLAEGTYQFELKVTDNAGATARDTLIATVLPAPNQPPVANAGSDQTITLPKDSVLLSGNASDADGTIASYLWTKVSGPEQFSIASSNDKKTIVNDLTEGTYQFELKVTDNAGATATDTLTVTLLPVPNQPPVANAGSDQVITLPKDSVLLSGSASDAEGPIASYLWSKVSGPAQFSIASPDDKETIVNDLTEGTYQFELKVTDKAGATATDTLIITVLSAPNQPPVADAGSDQSIILPLNTVSLSGSGTDVDGTIASYGWTKVSGPSQFTISNTNIAAPVLTNLVAGTYTFRLTVTDNKGATATDDMNVVVTQILAGYKLIPGKIEAEAYTSMSGIKTENTSDAGGGLDVGWIDNGDRMDFNVYVDSAGTYTVNFRVATANNGAKLQLRKSDGTVLGSLDLPNTASYQGWITRSIVVSLAQGYQTIRVISTASLVWNFNWMEFVRGVPSAKIIPAKIEAEAYTTMLGIQMEPTGDTGGGLNVGWINNNDWLDYYVNASSAGTYNVTFRIATPNTAAKLSITKPDGTVLANVNIPKTGGYQTWSTVSTGITLPQGPQTLRIISKAAQDFNFNWLEFTKSSSLIAQNTEDFSRTERVEASMADASSFEISPNPVRDRFNLTINNENTGIVKIQVADLQGSVRKEFRQVKDLRSPQTVNLSLNGLTPGIYTIRLQIGNWSYSKLIFKE